MEHLMRYKQTSGTSRDRKRTSLLGPNLDQQLNDILFTLAYQKMKIGEAVLRPSNTQLYGFTGECVHPEGVIGLPVTFGEEPTATTQMVDFLVVDKGVRVIKGCQTSAREYYTVATKPDQKVHMVSIIYSVDDVEVIP
ncbi:hypothetical protein PanWU01x14_138360 [Parasponia andersonii]|uniref:Uncharacterized protein n=1 Tax=Parasponia andersonii TaxID=3476 RepID=A0A2P5CND8_PARAD|nr:hypothetical protein PanWU01x14_138360 [Parasponia andersonii]